MLDSNFKIVSSARPSDVMMVHITLTTRLIFYHEKVSVLCNKIGIATRHRALLIDCLIAGVDFKVILTFKVIL